MEPARAAHLYRPPQYADTRKCARIQEWANAPGIFVLGRGVEQSRGLINVLAVDIGACRDECDAAFAAIIVRSTHERSVARNISRVHSCTMRQQTSQCSKRIGFSSSIQRCPIVNIHSVHVGETPRQQC